ncbi:MAG: DNA-binding protein [Chloroflexi bacterium]|nr:DNA-binding protein [Chloroflexota bacterium]
MDEQITVRSKRAAEILDISLPEFKKRLATGDIRSIKVGAMRLVEIDELRRWVARQRETEPAVR